MSRNDFVKTLVIAMLTGAATLSIANTALAHGPGYGMGSVMMTGPGMMGPAPGMWAGTCMSPGVMGYGALNRLGLTADQWSQVNAINDELAKQTWDLGARIRDKSYKLRGLMANPDTDSATVANEYRRLQDLQAQGLQARLDAQRKMEGVLTAEQRGQLHRYDW